MNRHPNGKLLTAEDLVKIALDNGILTPATLEDTRAHYHSTNGFYSRMVELTTQVRYDMAFNGKLKMDTRVNYKPKPIPGVDPAVMAYFQSIKAS